MKQKKSTPATYFASTHPGFLTIIFILIGVVGYVIFDRIPMTPEDEKTVVIGIWIVGIPWAAMVLWYACQWTHKVSFAPEGLVFCRFGRAYRILPWDRVALVGLGTVYKATRFTLVITPVGVPVFDTAGNITTWYIERYRHKLILLDATKENLAAIDEYYGELDYSSK